MKNIVIITVLFFVTACGYTSVYKNKTTNLQINILEMRGDNEFNNFIKNEINLYSNNNSKNKYEISILSKYIKNIISKDTSGVATDFKVSVNAKISIINDEETKEFEFNEKINIKNNLDSFEQNSYERNIKKNFASTIREKLITKILSTNDN
ncbi:hypothetical protein OAS83_01765 [Candidatus Pelagibacter sp.]|jgi:hypothetical protein|nr:hypothetical protein [Candidatus Pelagibacter sp.]